MNGVEGPRRRTGLWVYYASLVAVALSAAAFAVLSGARVSYLTRDLFTIARIPVYAGLLSNFGVFLWCAAASLCLFAWAVCRGARQNGFILVTGAFSAVLMADDFWMFHEWIAPRFLGVPEEVVMGAYGILLLLYIARYRGRIQATAPRLFVVALALMAVDVGLDLIEPQNPGEWRYIVEDGFKFFAIGTWLAFAAAVSAAAVRAERKGGSL